VVKLSELRQVAREQRDYAEADRLREQLLELGWEVRDGPAGPELIPTR
jgi:cysteinyl-tRNA synthetase